MEGRAFPRNIMFVVTASEVAVRALAPFSVASGHGARTFPPYFLMGGAAPHDTGSAPCCVVWCGVCGVVCAAGVTHWTFLRFSGGLHATLFSLEAGRRKRKLGPHKVGKNCSIPFQSVWPTLCRP